MILAYFLIIGRRDPKVASKQNKQNKDAINRSQQVSGFKPKDKNGKNQSHLTS